MELNVTTLFNTMPPRLLSASIAELGENAGVITYRNALKIANLRPFGEIDADCIRAYLAGFGAWEREELADMTTADLTAILIQLIAGDAREAGYVSSWSDVDFDKFEGYEKEGGIYRYLDCS